MTAPVRRLVSLILAAGIVLTACGAAEIVENDDLVSARWRVTQLEVNGSQADVSDIFIELSTVQSSLRVDSNCHELYGSFTIENNDGVRT